MLRAHDDGKKNSHPQHVHEREIYKGKLMRREEENMCGEGGKYNFFS